MALCCSITIMKTNTEVLLTSHFSLLFVFFPHYIEFSPLSIILILTAETEIFQRKNLALLILLMQQILTALHGE